MFSRAISTAGIRPEELKPYWPKDVINMNVKLCCSAWPPTVVNSKSKHHWLSTLQTPMVARNLRCFLRAGAKCFKIVSWVGPTYIISAPRATSMRNGQCSMHSHSAVCPPVILAQDFYRKLPVSGIHLLNYKLDKPCAEDVDLIQRYIIIGSTGGSRTVRANGTLPHYASDC